MPRPLLLLLPVVLLCSTIWSVWNPLWQTTDEPQHFGYVESLAELGHRPNGHAAGQLKSAGDVSTVTKRTEIATNEAPVAFDLYARPPWSELAERRYERTARVGPRDNGGGRTGASSYPPLYYALETLPYRAASGATALDRAYVMRWFSGLWALVSAVGGWLLVGEVLGRRRLPQLAGAATLGLWPMILYLSAAINPDAMLTAMSALALWQMVRIARRGTALWTSVALLVTVGAAAAAKVSGAALAPAALFVIVAGLPAVRTRTRDRARPLLLLAVALLVVPLLVLLAASGAGILPAQLDAVVNFRPDLHGFASYLWQFYLPRLGFMDRQNFMYPVISHLPVYNLWFGMSWGTFGWNDIWFPRWVYWIFFVLSLTVLTGAGVAAVRARRHGRDGVDRGSAAATIALAIAALGVLTGVHLQDYSNGVDNLIPFAQGRYLFPVAGIGAVAVAAAVSAVPARLRAAAAGAWLGFLIVFQVAALALLATRFYA